MNLIMKGFALLATTALIVLSSCSKKADPDTSLFRNSGNNLPSAGADGFNSGTEDDLSLAGDPLLGSVNNE